VHSSVVHAEQPRQNKTKPNDDDDIDDDIDDNDDDDDAYHTAALHRTKGCARGIARSSRVSLSLGCDRSVIWHTR